MQFHNEHSSRKILIVDDNPDIHNDFKTILNRPRTDELDRMEAEIFGRQAEQPTMKHAYDLCFASQGQEALALVKHSIDNNEPFQLAFVDMRMPPGWDGLETIERIWKIDPDLQVVLCTAYSDYSWNEINKRLRFSENLLILKKPFDVSEVAQMASTLTQKWLMTKAAMARQDELEAIVEKRTEELQGTNKQLEAEVEARRRLSNQLIRAQKMEAIGTLAAGVAHDLNNILSGIVSYPDLLLQQLQPQDPIYQKIQLIQQTGLKAAAIVQDMLTLGRRAVAKKDEVDLKTLIEEYLQSPEWTKTQHYYQRIRVETSLTANVSKVIGSEHQILKSLMNLISNAAEAIDESGTITISVGERTLDEVYNGYETIPPGKYVVLSVADTGEGINQKDIEHIFEPFYTKKVMGRSGTGLGLAVVWGAIRDHDGYLDIHSRPGHGAKFDLYFADSGIKSNMAQDAEQDLPGNGTGEFILVVDDVREQREITTEMLDVLGYSADALDSGEAGLEYLKKKSADVLLLDMTMDPGIDGLETYQRALSINPQQKAIIASGYSKNERVEAALALGASVFLQKPFSLSQLASAVKRVLLNRS